MINYKNADDILCVPTVSILLKHLSAGLSKVKVTKVQETSSVLSM